MSQAMREKREALKAEELKRLKKNPLAYGGALRNTREGRARPRPLSTRHSMHLVLRSSQAKGQWGFRQPRNQQRVRAIVDHFALKHRVKIHKFSNARNHLHLHVQLEKREGYKPFIRAVTAAIAMAVTRASRFRPLKCKFWDLRPFTRLVTTKVGFKRLNEYLELNDWEALGNDRFNATMGMIRAQERERAGWEAG